MYTLLSISNRSVLISHVRCTGYVVAYQGFSMWYIVVVLACSASVDAVGDLCIDVWPEYNIACNIVLSWLFPGVSYVICLKFGYLGYSEPLLSFFHYHIIVHGMFVSVWIALVQLWCYITSCSVPALLYLLF